MCFLLYVDLYFIIYDPSFNDGFKSSKKKKKKKKKTYKGTKSQILDVCLYVVLTYSENSYANWRRQLCTQVKENGKDDLTSRPFSLKD